MSVPLSSCITHDSIHCVVVSLTAPFILVLSYVLANAPMESNGQGWVAWSSLVEMC